ncbi:hypothetical protein KKB55_15950 [Myxococcota bacterium]|nr:hypothetical protein [Myxococcota bacterium]MBU1899234.1 hypothetical protein [Myxococcota bacterium]
MSALYIALPLVFTVGLIFWRLRPYIYGRRRPADSLLDRADRWNRYVKPLLEKTITEELLVAKMMVFDEGKDGQHSMCTWSLAPSILPQTDYVALAREREDRPEFEVLGVIAFEELRGLCALYMQGQSIWGHMMWTSLWPKELDLDTLAADLLPLAQFRGADTEK